MIVERGNGRNLGGTRLILAQPRIHRREIVQKRLAHLAVREVKRIQARAADVPEPGDRQIASLIEECCIAGIGRLVVPELGI